MLLLQNRAIGAPKAGKEILLFVCSMDGFTKDADPVLGNSHKTIHSNIAKVDRQ